MKRTHRTIVTSVHSGEKVETFRAANLTKDNTVRTHTKGVLNKVANRNRALPLKVRWTRFKRQPVWLLQTKLCGILNGQHALARVDHFRQSVEHSGFTRTRTARDNNVHPAGTADFQRCAHLLAHRTKALQHVESDRFFGELTN